MDWTRQHKREHLGQHPGGYGPGIGGDAQLWTGRLQGFPEHPATTVRKGDWVCLRDPPHGLFANILFSPIAFHPASVIFETPNHAVLLEKVGVRDLISGVIDELLSLAAANGCKFDADFKQKTMDEMCKSTGESIMWQDYISRRPMEVEIYLGSPIKLARDSKVAIPRIESLYAILHNLNMVNRNRPKGDVAALGPPTSPTAPSPLPPRMPSQNGHRQPPLMNGNGMPPRGPRPRNSSNLSQAGMRRGPPPMNGGPAPNGYGRIPPAMNMNMVNGGGSRQPSRRGSMDESNLEEFSHLVLYDDIPEGSESGVNGDTDLALREREMQLRQREMALREQEMRMRRGPPPSGPHRRGPPPPSRNSKQVFDDDDDDDDDYFDPTAHPAPPMIDPDNFDMMSVTSKKNRKVPGPSAAQIRRNPDELANNPPRGSRFRPSFGGRNRQSQLGHAPTTTADILDDPLMNYSSNRYGAVDRGTMNAGSRANSLTASRMEDLQFGPGPGGPPGMNGAYPRRTSHSPGNPYSPSMRGGRRPSPPNGYGGPGMNGRPSPPDGVRQPVPRYPPGQGNQVAPQQVEQHIGVSNLPQMKPKNVPSLTGSASASADSGEFDSGPSAHSSQGSLQQRAPIGVQ